METIDYTTATTALSQLGALRHSLARAVSLSVGNAAKVAWLTLVLDEIKVIVTAGGSANFSDLTSNITSNQAYPGLLNDLIRAASEADLYGAVYKAQVLADLVDARAILVA